MEPGPPSGVRKRKGAILGSGSHSDLLMRLLTASFVSTVYACLLGPRAANSLVLAPFDEDPECRNITTPAAIRSRSNSDVVVLLDSHSYQTLDRLWFADDESIDLFTFPIPTDPEVWELVDDAECRNVWRYCGSSTSDILLTQFITRGEVAGTEVVVGIDFNFLSETLPDIPLSCSEDNTVDSSSGNVLIVEADDTFTVYSQVIPCGVGRLTNDSTGIQHYYYEFTFTPMDSFELVVRANLSDTSCVNVSRIRVFHHICPNVTINYVNYQQTAGGMYSGSCVPNALKVDGSNVTALCTPLGDWIFPPNLTIVEHCLCSPGYYPDNVGMQCIPCVNGTYKSTAGSNICMPCPMNSHNVGEGSSFCQCNAAYSRANPQDVTTNCEVCARNYYALDGVCSPCPAPGLVDGYGMELEACRCLNGTTNLNYTEEGNSALNATCQYCARDYYRSSNNDSCLLCPFNSLREPDVRSEGICNCTPGSLTADGLNQTTVDPCDKCDQFHFVSDSGCLPCPAYSSSMGLGDTRCICEANTGTPYGNTTTTVDNCVCLDGLFRSQGGHCVPCPLNSNRRINANDDYCLCDIGYIRRPRASTTEPCYGPVLGFSQQTLQVQEGSSFHIFAMRVYLSFPAPEDLSVYVNVTGESGTVQDRVTFPSGETYVDYFIDISGDQVALESDEIVQIELLQSGSGYIIGSGDLLGNQSYYSALNIEVREDDIVYVGFVQSNVTSAVSESYLELVVGISTNIGRDLAILVTQNVSLSVFTIPRTTITFTASGPRHLTVPIQLSAETTFLVDAYYVGISIELVEQEFLRDEVRIGGGNGLNERLTMVLLPPRAAPSLSQGAEIGIISFCAAFVIVVLALVGVLTYCYCRHKTRSHKKQYYRSTSSSDDELNKVGQIELEPRTSKSHEN